VLKYYPWPLREMPQLRKLVYGWYPKIDKPLIIRAPNLMHLETSCSVHNLEELTMLVVYNGPITRKLEKLPLITFNNMCVYYEDYVIYPESLVHLELDNVSGQLDLNLPNLESFKFGVLGGIRSGSFNLPRLQSLDLSSIAMFDLFDLEAMSLTRLKLHIVGVNQINKIMSLKNLETLECSILETFVPMTEIETFDVSHMTNLKTLILEIPAISEARLPDSLEMLSLHVNRKFNISKLYRLCSLTWKSEKNKRLKICCQLPYLTELKTLRIPYLAPNGSPIYTIPEYLPSLTHLGTFGNNNTVLKIKTVTHFKGCSYFPRHKVQEIIIDDWGNGHLFIPQAKANRLIVLNPVYIDIYELHHIDEVYTTEKAAVHSTDTVLRKEISNDVDIIKIYRENHINFRNCMRWFKE
jgi:hypothetical protein